VPVVLRQHDHVTGMELDWRLAGHRHPARAGGQGVEGDHVVDAGAQERLHRGARRAVERPLGDRLDGEEYSAGQANRAEHVGEHVRRGMAVHRHRARALDLDRHRQHLALNALPGAPMLAAGRPVVDSGSAVMTRTVVGPRVVKTGWVVMGSPETRS
jgi:hypothetical protein